MPQTWLLTLLTPSDVFPGQMVPTIVSLVWPLLASRAHFLKTSAKKCRFRHFLSAKIQIVWLQGHFRILSRHFIRIKFVLFRLYYTWAVRPAIFRRSSPPRTPATPFLVSPVFSWVFLPILAPKKLLRPGVIFSALGPQYALLRLVTPPRGPGQVVPCFLALFSPSKAR